MPILQMIKWGLERLSACSKVRYIVSTRVRNKIYLFWIVNGPKAVHSLSSTAN